MKFHIQTKIRHGSIKLACDKVGGIKSLSKYLNLPLYIIYNWCNFDSFPPRSKKEIKRKGGIWTSKKIKQVEKKMFDLISMDLFDIFPDELIKKIEDEKGIKNTFDHVREINIENISMKSYKSITTKDIMKPKEDEEEKKIVIEQMLDILSRLKPLHKNIIEMYFGINRKNPLTFEEISKEINCSLQNVSKVYERAFNKLLELCKIEKKRNKYYEFTGLSIRNSLLKDKRGRKPYISS